jgi:hypothetical protein
MLSSFLVDAVGGTPTTEVISEGENAAADIRDLDNADSGPKP